MSSNLDNVYESEWFSSLYEESSTLVRKNGYYTTNRDNQFRNFNAIESIQRYVSWCENVKIQKLYDR